MGAARSGRHAMAGICAAALALWGGQAGAQGLAEGAKVGAPTAAVKGSELSAQVGATTGATCARAYAVFADYGSMARFVPGMSRSQVIAAAPGRLIVEQEGRVGLGPVSVGYKSKSEVELDPGSSIVAKSVEGSDLKVSSSARFEPAGEGCKISYSTSLELSGGVPDFLALGMGKSVARSHMVALLAEMAKRHAKAQGAAVASALPSSP